MFLLYVPIQATATILQFNLQKNPIYSNYSVGTVAI